MSAIDPESSREVDVLDSFRGLAVHGDPEDPRARAREVHRQLSTFLMEYKFALDEVEVKINILREEFELDHDYSPIEHVKSRLKSLESLAEKVNRTNCPSDLGVIREQIRDIAGIRVTTAFVEDTYRFAEMLIRQRDVTVLARKDYIATPKSNGYQSLHLVIAVPVFLSDRTVQVPVEVQIRTIAMDFWASVEHRIYYKYDGQVPEHLTETLLKVAGTAADLDAQMERLRDEIGTLASDPVEPRVTKD
ncbi:GTP pyrophosphokinase [Nocardioides gilvus]|uniref:GTP pyrophosphokinase n=1 Tax=Nocardioides gilvus TaxID=1735589 RepID=UPI000D744E23|nr:GTP pyrophosphokinase family protein [Nocardioides gilvus]